MARPGSQIGAVIACCVGIALFVAMDGFIKAASLAVGVYSALLWRSVAGCGITGVALAFSRPRWPPLSMVRLHLLRGTIVGIMMFSFFWALLRLPLAEGIALSFVAPLIALYLAALWLGERVNRSAVGASLLGLAGVGVLVAGRIRGAFDAQALWGIAAVLFSALLYAINLIIQRRQAQMAGPVEIAFAQHTTLLLLFAPAAPWLAVWPDTDTWITIILAALLSSASLGMLAWAYARAEAQALIPFEYSAFLWSALAGWWMFDERLTVWMIAGAALITAGCLIATRQSSRPEHIEPASV